MQDAPKQTTLQHMDRFRPAVEDGPAGTAAAALMLDARLGGLWVTGVGHTRHPMTRRLDTGPQ